MKKATQTPRLVSRKEAAAELGFSRQRLERLIKEGRVHETAAGIDVDRAHKELEATIDQARRQQYEETFGKAKPKAEPKQRRRPYNVRRGAVTVASASGTGAADGQIFDFASARAAKEMAYAKSAQVKYDQLIATLIPRDEVRAKEFTVARMVRDRILGFPAKVANVVTPDAMKIIIDECDRLVRDMQEAAAKIAESSPS